MTTGAPERSGPGGASAPTETLAERKTRHLEICLDTVGTPTQGRGAGFEAVRFRHRSLPELSLDEISLAGDFLGRPIALPLFISCMTGGSDKGYALNKILAQAAQAARIPFGLGSHRILFRHAEVMPHFYLRPLAPDVPIFSNIGAVHLRDHDHDVLYEMNRRLEVDASVVHLNPGQEAFQAQGGDRDFRGVKDALARYIEKSPLPVIVKETGNGIAPDEVEWLLNAGAAYVDLAGAGGTSWILVEGHRDTEAHWQSAAEFADWGYGTAALLAALGPQEGRLLASGGLRTAQDAAKALALGARLAGMALPFAQAAQSGGPEAVAALIAHFETVLARVLLLTGSRSPADLSRAGLLMDPAFIALRDQLRAGPEYRP